MDRFLRNNNMVKAAALLIALLLWFVVRLGSNEPVQRVSNEVVSETVSNVAIIPVYDNVQYAVMSIEPKEATVDMTWKESAFRRSSFSNLQVEADLTNLTEGEHDVVLQVVGISNNIITTIKPYKVKVRIEKIQHKQVPVEITTTGSPSEGYKAAQPVIRPNRVSISVPQSMVDQVNSAQAQVSIDGAKETIIKQVKLTVYDWNGRPMEGQVTPQVVDVEIPITSPFKQMPIQVKLIGEPAEGYSVASLSQEPETVTVYAAQDILNKMDLYGGLELDLSGFKETRKLDLVVPLIPGVASVEPTAIKATVEIVPSEQKLLEQVPVTLTGQSNDYIYNLAAENISINMNLIGAPTVLNNVRIQDVQATVDLSNLGPGVHDLPVIANLPLFVKNQNSDVTVRVEIVTAANSGSVVKSPSPEKTPAKLPVSSTPSAGPETSNNPTSTPTPTPADTPVIVPSASTAPGVKDEDEPA
ncbi:MAG: hypothetical protein H7X86_13355 [Gorillibacterium sp.]|nr:hypothetical protein [Gorillibacterium sp.]